jgi:hypothetical protein
MIDFLIVESNLEIPREGVRGETGGDKDSLTKLKGALLLCYRIQSHLEEHDTERLHTKSKTSTKVD